MYKRVETLQKHLKGSNGLSEDFDQSGVRICRTSSSSPDAGEEFRSKKGRELISMLENKAESEDNVQLLKDLSGPVRSGNMDAIECLIAHMAAIKEGQMHRTYETWCRKYGGKVGSNIAVVSTITPQGGMPYIDTLVVIGHPEDARRVARVHVKKSNTYGVAFLGQGVLSTRDNDSWKEQRRHLSESFMPKSSLSKIFPVSRDRAKYAVVDRLNELSKGGKSVEINEFLLFEAMAQLQLALLGESEKYMNETNKDLRDSFKLALSVSGNVVDDFENRRQGRKYVQSYANAAIQRSRENLSIKGASESVFAGLPEAVKGPLMARIRDNPIGMENPKIDRDNAATFLFAGHDTTANLMTHFTYEMAKRPEWQKRIQSEVDDLFEKMRADNREMNYDDLANLHEMKNCINEVLRLHPSVPNGTFREFQFDDEIRGPGDKLITVKKGTNCIISPWLLHRNEELWGDDADQWNPDREWKPEEEWYSNDLWGTNPESERFAPFTHPPRDCMGKNFAQMEARVILSYLFHFYDVELAPPTKGKEVHEISINQGTLGPKEGLYVYLHKRR